MSLISRSKHPFHSAGGWESPGAEWAVNSSSGLDPVPVQSSERAIPALLQDGREREEKGLSCILLYKSKLRGFSALGRR